ncbi:3-deoxy-D-manno-octulosonic-acid transferase [Rhodovulum imhoffii]|uniref:3-deoxy-D-manno-octulosonic acid transferase n=1 Tax=Rhodovulum imhoffii TaxID=365340 RepID=A0A2T5BR18_9RHOB|nr:3-deoxy-D-manno-octulosonic acid transferase [Rhodovulum imhoffii]PTN01671.1 3-deoxy-D-manno-octulosonic-acid transferase [Rhodovulum imhoffii]
MIVYRILLALAAPFVAVRLLMQPGTRERLGSPPGTAGVVWIHAASNGELAAARPVIETLLQRDPALHLLVTCNSLSGRTLAQAWGLERVTVRLAPLDYRLALRRFLTNWAPRGLIIIENELWPNRLKEMARRGPVVVLGGRLSARSLRGWQRLPALTRKVVETLDLVLPQDGASRTRFAALGVPETRLGPVITLKSTVASPTAPEDIAHLRPDFPRRTTLLAASTHEGEDEILLDGFARAVSERPALRLILAPRHPRRGDRVQRLIQHAGLTCARRSRGDAPGAQVYLADTLGEMHLWYALAGMCFVGGSLVDKGGHTPFEPAAHGAALLHGPYLSNFAEVYAALEHEGGSRRIGDAADLSRILHDLAENDLTAMTAAAARALAPFGSTPPDKVVDRLSPLFGLPGRAGRAMP